MKTTLALLFASTLLAACAGEAPPKAPAPFDDGKARAAVDHELDDFHDAASRADEPRYFGHFATEGVFLGTDRTERWDLAAFRAYAHPHFAAGRGWTFKVERRAVTFGERGDVAWFDEDLRGEKLGPARGSGVLVSRGGRYLVAQYNLALTIPNERFGAVKALLEAPPSPPDLHERQKAAYAEATAAASKGDLFRARELLSALVAEAKTRPDDDLEFWLHNELTWVRWADGDLTAALAEVDHARATLDHATLPADKTRSLRLHEKWDRAYLLLELAGAATLTKKTMLASADAARADYDALAKEAGDRDGAAVLAAFFAVRKGDAKGALAAAKAVDVERDSDVQDLYVLATAFELGGDAKTAASIRARVCGAKSYLMKPLIVRALSREGHACEG